MSAANIAWKQISMGTKMACGAREARATSDGKLQFKVGGKPMRYIWVTYEAGQDLYTVEYFRVKRNDYAHITLEKMEGVYCDMLSEVVYSMVNK